MHVKNYRATLDVVIRKLRFDSSYDFVHEGEDEACFMEYRYECSHFHCFCFKNEIKYELDCLIYLFLENN